MIDEIGKMELFSITFQERMKQIFNFNIPVIATIGEKLRHPVKDYILKIPEVRLFKLTHENQVEIYNEIISLTSMT